MKRFMPAIAMALACASAFAALPTKITIDAYAKLYEGSSSDDDEIVIETDDMAPYATCLLQSTAGAMDVIVSLDGTDFSTAPYALTDLGAADQLPVLVTVAGRTYGLRGVFKKVRVLQNGATAVESADLRCGDM